MKRKHSAFGTYLVAATTLLGAAICALADNDDGDSDRDSGNSNNNSCGGYTNDDSNRGDGGANDGSCSGGYNDNNNNNNNNNCGGDGNENNGCGWGYGGDGGDGCGNGGNGNNQPNYTIPQGKLTVTTPDPTTMKWSGQTKLHDQMLSSNSYTAQGQISLPPDAKIDPNGTVGITRLFQSRGPNNALGAPSSIAVLSQDVAIHLLDLDDNVKINYGPYEPDQSVFSATGLPTNSVYGVETIELVYQSGPDPKTGSKTATVLDYQEIDVYQLATSQLNDYSTQQAVKPASGSSAYTYTGSAPRIGTIINNIYPGSTTWVSVYPQNSPQSAVTAQTSVATAAGGDASNRLTPFYVDTGNFVSGSGTYVVQVNEQMPNGTTVTVGKTPFNFSPTVLATASVGVTK